MTSQIIPELTEGQNFYRIIRDFAAQEDLINILEIGSSNGSGSTRAFIDGILSRSDTSNVRLFCLEMFQPAFQELLQNCSPYPFVHCYNQNSIALEDCLTGMTLSTSIRQHKLTSMATHSTRLASGIKGGLSTRNTQD